MARSRLLIRVVSTLLCAAGTPAIPAENDSAKLEFFERKIRPLLIDNCYTCHSADTNTKGGLRVDDRNGLLKGGESGAAVVPGQPEQSLLIRAVRQLDKLKMPPETQLSAEQVAHLEKWVADGAIWPAVEVPADVGHSRELYDTLRKTHWAWQPVRAASPPSVRDTSWPASEIDVFLLAKLEESNLQPVADADKLTLVRRATYDLTGLPPTPEAIDAFLADDSPQAFEKLVDRLLASPAYGERWGRHWLDVARFGESTGSSRNIPFPHAWRYRDYVVDAFNRDKPYDQFVREQIAGDLLSADTQQQLDEQRVATGFLALGVKDVNQRFKVRFIMDNIDEQIDTVSRSLLALTASCARCHDHKFDPIPTADYYALAGIFASTDLCAGVRNKMGGGGLDYYDVQMLVRLGVKDQSPEPDPEAAKKIEEARGKVAAAQAEFLAIRDKPEGDEKGPDGRPKRAIARQKWNRLQAELTALSDPVAQGAPAALGVRESASIGDTQIRIRGEAEQLGPPVARGFLRLVPGSDQAKINASQSGRLELAQWIANPDNPLTRRVIVNRVWHYLFGRGLVTSVDNFGVKGDVPSHPELLDHLATRFSADGWSIKKLVRSIMLSRAYRLSSDTSAASAAIDPANRLVWRHSIRRLDAEELRDTVLAVAGGLNLSRPEASPARELKFVEIRNNGPEARKLTAAALADRHRSVYLPLVRGIVPRPLEVFDFAEQGMVTGSRDATTVATQALYLLNDPFVLRQSLEMADSVLNQPDGNDIARINQAYRATIGRPPTAAEIDRALQYINDYSASLEQDSTLLAAKPTAPAAKPDKPAKKKAASQNPDEADQTDEPMDEQPIATANPRAAAWASFCQALFGSAEFRYLK